MTRWDEAIEFATADFIERLEQRGFVHDGERLTGVVPGGAAPTSVRIEFDARFPFTPPVVYPTEDFPRSWHRELSGAMCLYPSDSRENLPWLNTDDFLETVTHWLTESETGWTGDSPALDLDRYFPRSSGERLVVYGDLDSLTNRFIQLRHEGNVTRVIGAGSIPKGTKGLRKNRAFGYVASIGHPQAPPATWDGLRTLLPQNDARRIESAIRERRLGYLVIRYERAGVAAALTLRAWKTMSGNIEIASVRSASEAPETLVLRAGYAAERLANSRIVVVGAGAIGSFLCDALARSGLGHIAVYDPDIVRPGNLIRHLVDQSAVGLSKPEAVKRAVEAQPFNSTTVTAVEESVPGPQEVMALFTNFDLVVDAAAAGGVTDMLAIAAAAGGHRLLSVCLQEEGEVVRVDVIPPLDGDALPPTNLRAPLPNDQLKFEAGCGDPISRTPPFAVLEAASLAARCAVGILTDNPICSAGIVRDYR